MKEIIIEHSGSEYHNKAAQKIQTMLEHWFECEVDQMVGETGKNINLYNAKNMNEVAQFTAVPNKNTLRLHIALMI